MSGTGTSHEEIAKGISAQIFKVLDGQGYLQRTLTGSELDYLDQEMINAALHTLREARQHSAAVSSDTLTPQGEATSGIQATLPCVGCGKLIEESDRRAVDRYGWWHIECEQKAWEESGQGQSRMPAPFEHEWKKAKNLYLSARSTNTSGVVRKQ